MATDFAFVYFLPPLALAIIVLAITAIIPDNIERTRFLQLGRRRSAIGYLGVLIVVFLFSIVDSIRVGLWQESQGYIEASRIPELLLGWSIYQFVLVAPLAIFILTLVGLPIFALLTKYRILSVATLVLLAIAWGMIWAAQVYFSPYNNWCSANPGACMARSFRESLYPALLVMLSFALFTRLPLIKGPPRHKTNKGFNRTPESSAAAKPVGLSGGAG